MIDGDALARPKGMGTIKRRGDRYAAQWRAKHYGTFDTPEEAHAVLNEANANPDAVPPARTYTSRMGTGKGVTQGIGRYLDAIEAGIVDGKRGVVLGALGNGLPNSTTNPDDVERAIKVVREQARTGTAVQRLKRQQRIIELSESLDLLRNRDDSSREFFVEHAAAWATGHGISYGAFRAMGVPVEVLTEAGITRGSHP